MCILVNNVLRYMLYSYFPSNCLKRLFLELFFICEHLHSCTLYIVLSD